MAFQEVLILDYLWGIEMLIPSSPVSFTASDFRLPMRNWNFALMGLIAMFITDFRLPMRNWNIIDKFKHTSYKLWF